MLDLQPIKNRLAAATPGPWSAVRRKKWRRQVYLAVLEDLDCDLLITPPDGTSCTWKENDAHFIAHARQDVWALVAEVERLQDRVQELTDAIGFHRRSVGPESGTPTDEGLWGVLDG